MWLNVHVDTSHPCTRRGFFFWVHTENFMLLRNPQVTRVCKCVSCFRYAYDSDVQCVYFDADGLPLAPFLLDVPS